MTCVASFPWPALRNLIWLALVFISTSGPLGLQTCGFAQSSNPFRQGGGIQESGQTDNGSTADDAFSRSEKIAEALTYSSMGDHKRAMELMQQLHAKYPEDWEVLRQYFLRVRLRATQLARMGNPQEKYEVYKLAADLARRISSQYAALASREQGTPQGAKWADELQKFKKENNQVLYNEACALAIAGDKEKSIAALRNALDWGFGNLNFMLNDFDLASVTESPEFLAMLGEDLKKYKEQLKEAALKNLESFPSTEFDIELPDLDGNLVRVSDYRGKVLFLTFWASGHGQSVRNLRVLQRLQENLDDQNVAIVAVGCERTRETEDATATLKQFVNENDIPFVCLVASPRVRARMKDTQGFPSTMLIDAKGNLRSAFGSPHNIYLLETFAELLLAEENQ